MNACDIPADAQTLYYSTCYAADNNALETRSLLRSGETKIPQVKAARDAFFNQKIFKEREIWDKYLFDGDLKSAFSVAVRWGDHKADGSTAFMVDMGKVQKLDKITFDSPDEYSISPYKSEEGTRLYVSSDLKDWKAISFYIGTHAEADVSQAGPIRYLRLDRTPLRVSEVSGFVNGQEVDRTNWRASNLFRNYYGAKKAWSNSFKLDEIPDKAYLCIAVNGESGEDGAWAAIKVDGKYIGCPDRAPSFNANTWEYRVQPVNKNYTFYVPLTPRHERQEHRSLCSRAQRLESQTRSLSEHIPHTFQAKATHASQIISPYTMQKPPLSASQGWFVFIRKCRVFSNTWEIRKNIRHIF